MVNVTSIVTYEVRNDKVGKWTTEAGNSVHFKVVITRTSNVITKNWSYNIELYTGTDKVIKIKSMMEFDTFSEVDTFIHSIPELPVGDMLHYLIAGKID